MPGTVGAGREDGVGGGPRDTWGGGAVVFLMFPGDVCGWLYDLNQNQDILNVNSWWLHNYK